jgi:hypothetical protein
VKDYIVTHAGATPYGPIYAGELVVVLGKTGSGVDHVISIYPDVTNYSKQELWVGMTIQVILVRSSAYSYNIEVLPDGSNPYIIYKYALI